MDHFMAFFRSGSFGRAYSNGVKCEFECQTVSGEEILKENDILHLPAPVRKYIIYTGAIAQRKPQNARIAIIAEMFRNPGAKPMKALSD